MDVFDLVAKIRLDDSEYESGIGKAKGTFSNLASGVKTGLATVAKVGAAAVAAGAAGVVALTKMGVEGYAQYEQLVGGVETLFKESQNIVMGYAENAYKTSGMSANQYMETVTSFSASLIQSLDGDTAKAAEIGNMAITDMSDNANKMGTSMELIQNAYNGFAKGNYTMLDNLKLGYGGTKTEMERLLKDAQKISGIKYDISSFSDVTEAIHVMQKSMEISGYSVDELSDKLRNASLTQEEVSRVAESMGISYEEATKRMMDGSLTAQDASVLLGTTAREAATTIEGSIGMMKGAWQNLVVGMADENANMEVLINNFVESTAMAAQNLLPRIEQALKGIGQLIEKLAPVIAEALPVLVTSVLPSLLSAGVSLVTALVEGVITALPALYNALLDGVKIILVEVFGVSEAKAGEFADSVNSFFVKIKDGFLELVESAQTDGTWLNDIWTGLQETGQAFRDFLVALWDAISAAFTWCVEQINTEGTVLNSIWEEIKTVISSAVSVIKNIIKLFTAVLKGDWSAAWDAIKNIVKSVWDAMKARISTVSNVISTVISGVWNGIKSVTSSVWEGIKSAVSNAINGVKSTVSSVWEGIKSTTVSVWNAIKSAIITPIKNAWDVVSGVIEKLKSAFDFEWSLPDLKLPHISVSGGKAPYGIGGKGSLPKFSIQWYKKAYDNAMILSNPTIFGYSAASGKFLGGGDGNGNEIVAGESYLMNLIGNVVAERNGQIAGLLAALLEATVDGNGEMVRALKAGQIITLNERELGRAVRGLA